MATIGYQDKVALYEETGIADINKVTDDDMNEIKQVVNENATMTDTENNALVVNGNNVIYDDTGLIINENITINNTNIKLSDLGVRFYYCSIHQTTASVVTTGSAWGNPVMTLGAFETNNSDVFEFNNNKIKIKQNGTYVIFRAVVLAGDNNLSERDFTAFVGATRYTNFNWGNSGTQILVSNINANNEIYFSINTASTSITTTNQDILIIKIS